MTTSTRRISASSAVRESNSWGRGSRVRVYLYHDFEDKGIPARVTNAQDWKSFKIYKSATRKVRETEALAAALALRVNSGELTFKQAKALFEIPQH